MSLADETRVKSLALQIYTEDEAETFMGAEQPLLDNQRPIDLIWDGRADEVINMLNRMIDGVYI